MRIAPANIDCCQIYKFEAVSVLRSELQQKSKSPAQGRASVLLRAKPAIAHIAQLFGGHFFGFAFLAHDFELAFLRLDLRGDFLLDALCRFFQFR